MIRINRSSSRRWLAGKPELHEPGLAKLLVGLPVGMERAKREHPDLALEYGVSPLEAAEGGDAVVFMTEWDEFLHADWQMVDAVMRGRMVTDEAECAG